MNLRVTISSLWQKIKSSESPPTDRVFKGVWRRREWRIDSVGVHEFRQGEPYTTVLWGDLKRFDGQKLRAINGAGSTVFLPQDRLSKFRQVLYFEWERRSPESFRAHQAWSLRRVTWMTFFWLPLFYALLCVPVYYVLPIAAHRGVPTAQLHARADRLTLVSIVTVAVFWGLYGYSRWKARRKPSAP